MYTDFNAKWTILEQTDNNSSPIALTLFGSMAIDGKLQDKLNSNGRLTDSKGDPLYKYLSLTDRFSYFSQVIIGRKFTNWLSLQAGASFTHYNTVEWDYSHDIVGFHFNGRAKISDQTSFIFNYDLPLKIKDISEQLNWDTHALPNVCFGVEIATFTHAFQIYFGTADGIIQQDIMMYNQDDWKNKGLAIGFNITRLWMY